MKGDFLGFSFNGYHSDSLGIVRVSDGERYTSPILPEFEDKTTDIPGNDGTYYYGSYFNKRDFTFSVAFDHLTEIQFRDLKRVFSNKKVCPLVFDEAPYKVYKVKLATPPEINYICFEEKKYRTDIAVPNAGVRVKERVPIKIDDEVVGYDIVREDLAPYVYYLDDESNYVTENIYKGEMTLDFIAYKPFSVAPYKVLESYDDYDNRKYWEKASGLLSLQSYSEYDKYIVETVSGVTTRMMKIYNPGDLSSSFRLYIPFTDKGNSWVIDPIRIEIPGVKGAHMQLKKIVRKTEDTAATGIWINTYNHLIEGVIKDSDKYTTTGYVYNQFIDGGNFFKIPALIDFTIHETGVEAFDGRMDFIGSGDPWDTSGKLDILYDYLYY